MSVLIKGMEMPTKCCECPCYYDEYNECNLLIGQKVDGQGTPPENCPLIPVPDHGGRVMNDYPVYTIDKVDDAPMKAFRFAKDLYERIIEAENLAFMNEIKANTVVINGRKYGMLKYKPGFAPTIIGMRAETKVDMPDEWDFFLQERPPHPQTNADRIRAMTDDELVQFFVAGWHDGPLFMCPVPGGCKSEDCRACFGEWLKSPVEVET